MSCREWGGALHQSLDQTNMMVSTQPDLHSEEVREQSSDAAREASGHSSLRYRHTSGPTGVCLSDIDHLLI